MSTVASVRRACHECFCEIRKLNYLVQGANFEIAWKAATVKERWQIETDILKEDKKAVKDFITKKLLQAQPFERMGIRKLRDIGKHLGVQDYAKINKLTLIEEIQNVATTLKANSKRKRIQSSETNSNTTDSDGCGRK